MHPDTVGLIVNRAPQGKLNEGIQEEIRNQGLTLLGVVPQDESVYEFDCEGRPTVELPEDNPVKKALREIAGKLNIPWVGMGCLPWDHPIYPRSTSMVLF